MLTCGDDFVRRSDVTFVFGDLHLKDIKAWREEHMGGLGVNCMFPLFQQPYSDLAEELTCSPYKVSPLRPAMLVPCCSGS